MNPNIPNILKGIPLPVAKGEGGLVEVYGGPGMGKSTLCYQWLGAALTEWGESSDVILLDLNASFVPEWTSTQGVDRERLLVMYDPTLQGWALAETVMNALASHPGESMPLMVVVDGTNWHLSDAELEAMRRTVELSYKLNLPLVSTRAYRTKEWGTDPGPDDVSALAHTRYHLEMVDDTFVTKESINEDVVFAHPPLCALCSKKRVAHVFRAREIHRLGGKASFTGVYWECKNCTYDTPDDGPFRYEDACLARVNLARGRAAWRIAFGNNLPNRDKEIL
jgi:hypothetical protein